MRGPGGEGAVAWAGRSDAARTADSVTLRDAAARLSRLVKHDLRYELESPEDGRRWRAKLGAPDWEVDTWVGSYEAIAANEVTQVSTTVERVTRTTPESIER
mgnify:CR=1 FL=1